MSRVTILGWDCATQPKNNGVAIAEWSAGERTRVLALHVAENDQELLSSIEKVLAQSHCTLIAADIPLGWPKISCEQLASHHAGMPLPGQIDMFFRRLTDREVYRRLGKLPLEINADRIGRAAWATLNRIEQLRQCTGLVLPLHWHSEPPLTPAILEVYPGGTRRAMGLPNKLSHRYTKEDQVADRRELLKKLDLVLAPVAQALATENQDAFDALLCVVAAVDVLEGRAVAPTTDQLPFAHREGWIWVRNRDELP
ncbi:MAG: DUF429 domain-containing protein [Planctomycetota bacterium]